MKVAYDYHHMLLSFRTGLLRTPCSLRCSALDA